MLSPAPVIGIDRAATNGRHQVSKNARPVGSWEASPNAGSPPAWQRRPMLRLAASARPPADLGIQEPGWKRAIPSTPVGVISLGPAGRAIASGLSTLGGWPFPSAVISDVEEVPHSGARPPTGCRCHCGWQASSRLSGSARAAQMFVHPPEPASTRVGTSQPRVPATRLRPEGAGWHASLAWVADR
jgi:hypothetical protein